MLLVACAMKCWASLYCRALCCYQTAPAAKSLVLIRTMLLQVAEALVLADELPPLTALDLEGCASVLTATVPAPYCPTRLLRHVRD
eukprot:321868-Rhodomonas_salina.1